MKVKKQRKAGRRGVKVTNRYEGSFEGEVNFGNNLRGRGLIGRNSKRGKGKEVSMKEVKAGEPQTKGGEAEGKTQSRHGIGEERISSRGGI